MLAVLRRVVPAADAIVGAAEALPLGDASVDAVTMGQSFHWFRHEEAIPELRRVLRPGGAVGLIWNSRDESMPVQRAISDLIKPFIPTNRPPVVDSTRALHETDLFGAVDKRTFRFTERLDADAYVGRIASISFVAAAEPDRRAALERRLREVVAAHGGIVELGYVTEVYVSFAV